MAAKIVGNIPKLKPLKKTKLTEGEKVAKKSQSRAVDLVSNSDQSDGLGHVAVSDAMNKPIEAPKWVTPENKAAYVDMIKLIVQCEFDNISQFCRDNSVSRGTIYNWLLHQDTKDTIDKAIKAIAVVDKPKIYQMITAQVPTNAAYARLWAERYEEWQPKTPTSGNVIINFNFLDALKPQPAPAEDAEFTEEDEQ